MVPVIPVEVLPSAAGNRYSFLTENFEQFERD